MFNTPTDPPITHAIQPEETPSFAGRPGDRPIVRTRAGRLRGKIISVDEPEGLLENLEGRRTTDSPCVAVWRGVYYGQSTAGEGRFRTPAPVAPWDGVLDATDYRPPAMQPNSQMSSMAAVANFGQKVIGTENCLHLDVVRPASNERLPVMVYFHGGSFVSGASHEKVLRGHRLSTALNAVYVSVNFRLGVLGYLNVHDIEGESDAVFDAGKAAANRDLDGDGLGRRDTANPAIADQILALRWVQENIGAFGGDPDRVTIVGESAGANAVTTLMAVPAARGLFHAAIAQSSPAASVHTEAQTRLWSSRLRQQLGKPADAPVDELREVPAVDMVRAGQAMSRAGGEARYLNSCFSPMVDGDILPEHPLTVFARGEQAPVPLIVGTTLDEASFSKFIFQRMSTRSAMADRVTRVFDPIAAPTVLEAYDGAVSREDFAELFADAVFWAPSVQVAESHSTRYPTWMYRFDFAPQALRWIGLGAIHSLDLAVLFGDPDAHRATNAAKWAGMPGYEDVVTVMQHNWARFVHTGRPLDGWPAYEAPADGDDSEGRATLLLDEESRIECDPQPERRAAWMGYDLTKWGRGRPELLAELGIDLSAMEILDDPTDQAQW